VAGRRREGKAWSATPHHDGETAVRGWLDRAVAVLRRLMQVAYMITGIDLVISVLSLTHLCSFPVLQLHDTLPSIAMVVCGMCSCLF
jgi:hypothetical protein